MLPLLSSSSLWLSAPSPWLVQNLSRIWASSSGSVRTCSATAAAAAAAMASENKLFSLAEVGQHVAQDDCWIVVNGKVYNLTTFMDDHPGGDDVLLKAAGRDATVDFEDVGHSKAAIEQMNDFYVGECPEVLEKKLEAASATEMKFAGRAAPAATNSVGIFSKIFQFLVPLLLLGLAFALRKHGKKEDIEV